MSRVLALFAVLGLLALPAFGAAKADNPRAAWPTRAQVEKAAAQVKWSTEDTITTQFRGKTVKFVPADVGDGDYSRGVVYGKIISGTDSKGGLTAGTYVVYLRKDSGSWEVYFCQEGAPVAKSKSVVGGQDNARQPTFQKAGAYIHYGTVLFEW